MDTRAGLDRWGKSRPTGIRSPDRPARSQSLYRLRYPIHVLYLYRISSGRNPAFYEKKCEDRDGQYVMRSFGAHEIAQ